MFVRYWSRSLPVNDVSACKCIFVYVHVQLYYRNTTKGTTTLDQSGPGSNGDERVFHILQSSKTGTLLSNSLVSYPGLLMGIVFYSAAEMQLVYSTALTNWPVEVLDIKSPIFQTALFTLILIFWSIHYFLYIVILIFQAQRYYDKLIIKSLL